MPYRAQARGRCRLSHISLGNSISGDTVPPTKSSTLSPVAVISAASAPARWSAHITTFQRSSSAVETVTGAPEASSMTSEQVASKATPPTAEAGYPLVASA